MVQFRKRKDGSTYPIVENKKRSRYTGQTGDPSWKEISIKDVVKIRRNDWQTARSFRTQQEATEHKEYLASRTGRSDQDFKVVKGTDETYPYEVQWRNK